MEKNEAIQLIDKTFNAKFDAEQFTFFISNLLNDFNKDKERDWAQGNYIYESFREHINRFKRLGVYTDPEGHEVELLIVETKATSKLERARTSLRNFVIKRLRDKNRDYALVAFYSKEDNGADWRFSFVKIEHESFKDDKGKVKTKKELTPAKRYSFLVGEHEQAHTAQKQLLPVLQNDYSNPTVEDLEKAFGIEKVTDEFFEQYKELYLKLAEHFNSNKAIQKLLTAAEIDTNRFTKKLLGQIVFLYFLQKKGWLGVPKTEAWGKGERRFLQNLYEEANDNSKNFFKDYLQYLFYEALAKARSHSPDPSYYKRFDCKIPFLNGGLFEADYEWETANLSIPNNLFRNIEKNKEGDKGTGVLDVLDRYNFTIKEDEPLEKEVAVDPEMLGKVFENMLEITERKSKGAFYTPREIVHYMCQESLIHYLNNAVNDATESYEAIDSPQLSLIGGAARKKGQGKLEIEHKGKTLVPKTDIETFIRKGFLATENDQTVIDKGKETDAYKFQLPQSVRESADELDEKLSTIKICDPAIGSGAFPVGLLHELVTAQRVLQPYLSEKYLQQKLKLIDLDKADYKKDPEKYIYRVKRHAIQESIYGVDIDASAIDIARLRLWLSLIVDEEDFYSIEALPNLDYKIVRGSSVIGVPHGFKNWGVEDEIEIAKVKFFNSTDEKEKKKLRKEINAKIRTLLDSSEDFAGYKIDFDFKLFFSEVWHSKKGFDIVIANPPFVSAWEMTKNDPTFRDAIKASLKNYKDELIGHWDLFVAFIVTAHKLVNSKGAFVYILPNPILREKYAAPIRHFLLSKMNLKSILHFDEINVFKKVSRKTVILYVSQEGNDRSVEVLRNSTWGTDNQKIFVDRVIPKDTFLNNEGFKFTIDINKDSHQILEKIDSLSVKLGSIYYVNYGAQVSSKSPGGFKKNEVVGDKKIGNAKKFVEGKDLARWKLRYRKLWLDYRKEEMYGPRTEDLFESLKIIIRKVSDKNHKIAGSIDYNKYYTDDGIVLATSYNNVTSLKQDFIGIEREEDMSFSIEYVASQLFNCITDYYFKNKFATESLQGATSHTYPKTVRDLPVFKNPKQVEDTLTNLVKYIMILKNDNSDNNLALNYYLELLDGIQINLYFPIELKQANKEIIKHLGNLKAIEKSMSDEKKLAIIQSEFNRLYDPNHPVRNNLETLDSIEEIRIIKEAVK